MAADGFGGEVIVHGRIIGQREADKLTLAEALGAGHVVSRCPSCGHRESAETAWWEGSATDRGSTRGSCATACDAPADRVRWR